MSILLLDNPFLANIYTYDEKNRFDLKIYGEVNNLSKLF